jgi:hypothetical protein
MSNCSQLLWMTFGSSEQSHPTDSSRLLELAHEATLRGKPELIDQARTRTHQAGSGSV